MKFILMVLAVHSIAHTITTQTVFKPMREFIAPKLGPYWENLVRCPYCLGHWVALVAILVYGYPFNVTGIWILDAWINWHAVVAVANLITWVLCDRIKKPKIEKLDDYLKEVA